MVIPSRNTLIMDNYYTVLGVKKSASQKTIKEAYRRLARKHHPDLNPEDKAAEQQFKRINEAYEVLSNSETREKYDRYGNDWKQAQRADAEGGPYRYTGGGFGGDLFDLFGEFGHGGKKPIQRLETSVEVSLEEAFAGTNRKISLVVSGKPRRLNVSIPPGVKTGSRVRISPSDRLEVVINIIVQQHLRFRRRGNDLHVDVEVPFEVAALGGDTDLSTMTGMVLLTIPKGSGSGRKIKLSQMGMPVLGSSQKRGNLIATVRPTVPPDLTNEQYEMLEKYRESRAAGMEKIASD